MSDTPNTGGGSDPGESVLRPFEAPTAEPLPPVEPSKVVPETPTATEELEPIEALEDDPFEPVSDEPFGVDTTDYDEVWAPSEIEPSEIEPSDIESTDTAEAPVVPAPPVNEVSADDLSDPLLEKEQDDEPAEALAAEQPPTDPGSETVTLPRKPFLVALGVIGAVFIVLVALWQTAGGDGDSSTATPGPDVAGTPGTDPGGDSQPDGADDPALADASGAQARLEDELATAETRIGTLEATIVELEARTPPALPGNSMRRIVTATDANFISAIDGSIGVVDSFGGYSLIDPATNRVSQTGDLGGANRVLRTPSSVWATNYQDNLIVQVDPGTNSLQAAYAFPGPDGITKLDDTLIVASFDDGFVAQIDPGTGAILQRVDVGGRPTDVYSGDLGLWAAVFDTGELVQIDPASFEIVTRVIVGAGPVGIGAGSTSLWVTNNDEGTVAKVDPVAGSVLFTTEVGRGPAEVVAVRGAAWVTVSDDGTLVQVDAHDGTVVTVTPLGGAIAGGGPTGIDYGDGSLWIAMQGEQSVVRIDI